jgi:vanillate O-demethylase ferredoxin subunit
MSAASVLRVRVARKAREAEDICTYELVDVDGRPLPAFSAGSHIDVTLPDGRTRQYSLCNDPGESHRFLIAVLREATGRGGSRVVHDAVHEGDVLQISAPKNHFALVHDASRSVLLAGGIGITPILCMAERLAHAGADFEMHYCTRSRHRTAFLDRIAESGFADRVHFHFDDEGPASRPDFGALFAQPSAGSHVYVCGPGGFIEAALGAARAAGWPAAHLHHESFSAAPVSAASGAAPFRVRLASSGREIVVAADQSVTQALAEAGVDIPVSCEQGVCGTCLTRVLGGEPEHRDVYLTPDEQARNDQFLPCCSRSRSPLLVLDL